MYTSLIFKEWIKTRKSILLLCVLFAALITYVFLWIAQLREAAGAVVVWETIISKDIHLVKYMKFIPLAAGLLLGVVQFAPEIQSKRLKLTLHLPMKESKIVCSMLGYGLVVLFCLFAIVCSVLMIGLSIRYAAEISMANFWVSLPWFIGGLMAYLFCAWICLEPVWKQRIFNAIPAVCILAYLYREEFSGAYMTYLPYMLIILVVSFFFPLYSTARFKDGVQ